MQQVDFEKISRAIFVSMKRVEQELDDAELAKQTLQKAFQDWKHALSFSSAFPLSQKNQ